MWCKLLVSLLFLSTTTQSGIVSQSHEKSPCSNYCSEAVRRCECDRLCSLFGDCCIDSDHTEANPKLEGQECKTVEFLAVYFISTCRSDTVPDDVKQKCIGDSPIEADMTRNVPYTDVETLVTYKNHYCAQCHEAENVTPWTVTVWVEDRHLVADPANLTQEFLLHNLEYNEHVQRWGVWLKDSGGQDPVFRKVSLVLRGPEQVEPRQCFHAVSECPPDWSDQSVRQKCGSYLDPVRYGGHVYRNQYCARCHGVGTQEGGLSCLVHDSEEEVARGAPFGFDKLFSLR